MSFLSIKFGKNKEKGRERKGRKRGGRKGKRKEKNIYTRSYLVCKREMERNIIFWWVPPSKISLLSPFPPKLGGKNLVGHGGKWIPPFLFPSLQSLLRELALWIVKAPKMLFYISNTKILTMFGLVFKFRTYCSLNVNCWVKIA